MVFRARCARYGHDKVEAVNHVSAAAPDDRTQYDGRIGRADISDLEADVPGVAAFDSEGEFG